MKKPFFAATAFSKSGVTHESQIIWEMLTASDKTSQSKHLIHAALYLQTASVKNKIIFL